MNRLPVALFLAALTLNLAACGETSQAPETATANAPAQTAPAPSAPAPAPASAAVDMMGMLAKGDLANPCFFTAEEVTAALGFNVDKTVPDTNQLDSYGIASCRYEGPDNVLNINLTWTDPAYLDATRQQASAMDAGDLDRVAGDADGAYLQYQKELGGALHYFRKNIMVELRPMTWRGVSNDQMKQKLLSMKRIP